MVQNASREITSVKILTLLLVRCRPDTEDRGALADKLTLLPLEPQTRNSKQFN